MVSKKSKKLGIVAFLLLLAIVGVGVIGGSMTFSTVSGVDTLVVPDWARISCDLTQSKEGHQTVPIALGGTSVYCGKDEYTDECVSTFTSTDVGTFGTSNLYYKLCTDLNNDNTCGVTTLVGYYKSGQTLKLPTITKGEKLFVFSATDYYNVFKHSGTVTKTYKEAKLYRWEGAKQTEIYSSGCVIPTSSLSNNILSIGQYSNTNLPTGSRLTYDGGENSKWINYVWRWVNSPLSANTVHYKGQLAYCESGTLYEVITITTLNGVVHKIAPDKTVSKEDAPNTYNGIGDPIVVKECCPNEPNCDPNTFMWKVSSGEGKPCASDLQCLGDGVPIRIDATTVYTQTCQDGFCKNNQPFKVECTSDSVCPSGMSCSLSRNNYGKCVENKGQGYCGDKICQPEESQTSCPTDCGTSGNQLPAWFVPAVILLLVGMFAVIVGYVAYNAAKKKRR